MKTVIIYKSKHGSTKEYAEYINKNIQDSEIYSYDSFDIKKLSEYDNIILGSSVYAGTTFYQDFLTKNWDVLKEKKVFVFAVGMLPDSHPNSRASYELIPEEIRERIQYVKLPGRVVLSKLNLFEKLIVKSIGRKEDIIAEDLVDLKKANSIVLYFK